MSNIGFEKPNVAICDIVEIAKQYSKANVIKAVYAGGVPNVTYIVSFDSDEPIALRVGNVGYTRREHLIFEVDVLSYLERVGFHWSPKLIPLLNGVDLIGSWGKFPVIAMKVIAGDTGDCVLATSQLCKEIGQSVGEMQLVLSKYDGAIPEGEDFWSRSARLLNELESISKQQEWNINSSIVIDTFREAKKKVQAMPYTDEVVHSDVWPPNIMVYSGHLSGILDFDDLAIGPGILDLVTAISEFGFDKKNDDSLEQNIRALIQGYCSTCNSITIETSSIILPLIEASYCQWLACNAVHRIPFMESEMYYRRICKFNDSNHRKIVDERLKCIITSSLEDGSSVTDS